MTAPLFSVVLLPGTGDDAATQRTVAQLREQSYAGWELVALRAAVGEFVLFHDSRDRLSPTALAVLASMIESVPETDIAYADEERADDGAAIRKPDWSPERFRFEDFLGAAVVMRTALVRDVGGLRPEFGAAMYYDLLLRVTERARSVAHSPRVALQRAAVHVSVLAPQGVPAADAQSDAAARRAVAEHLARLGIAATVVLDDGAPVHRLVRPLDPQVPVSIIVPTRGQAGVAWDEKRVFVVEAVRSALARTAHPRVEIVVVYDTGTPAAVLAELASIAGDRFRALEYEHPFNFSEKCNLGSLHASGDVLVLLNDDTQVRSDGWLEALVAPLAEPDVGMTGAKLLFEDGAIQFAGHLYSPPPPRKRQWRHLYHRFDPAGGGQPRDLLINRETSGITAACAALRRDVWEAVGGLNEGLPANYNDVDLSYKVRATGHRAVWVAGCEVYHFESRTRDKPVGQPEEIAAVERRWGRPDRDPYFPWPDP